ncbi:MAG: hypothetical protein LBU51_09360 [Bacteroidales bacterium]|jgi:3-oxoacyl-[acyl-carrier-protein] synthase-1|nr:hypothetical protein [Bacteroidales bacterium]
MKIRKYCKIDREFVVIDGALYPFPKEEGTHFLTALYRALSVDYPKFHKMDTLSKLGFLASELIFREEDENILMFDNMAIICFNRSSSLEYDTKFQDSIEAQNYYPSPSVFVYTLPNIVTGEIAIRNKLYGETSFYITPHFDAVQMVRTVENAFQDRDTQSVLAAWIEAYEETQEVLMMWVEQGKDGGMPFLAENINTLYNKSF